MKKIILIVSIIILIGAILFLFGDKIRLNKIKVFLNTFDKQSLDYFAAIKQVRQVWYMPAPNTSDTLDIFKPDTQIATATKNLIDVFGFYESNLLDKEFTKSDCHWNNQIKPNPCGPNLFENLAEVNAFSFLKQWNIDINIEAKIVKPYLCKGVDSAVKTKRAIDNVVKSGGKVKYISMDEPLMAGSSNSSEGQGSCNYTTFQIIKEIKDWGNSVKSAYPDIIIGEIEPYPFYTIDKIKEWILLLENSGIHLPFFHLDLDLLTAKEKEKNGEINIQSDLSDLNSFLKSKNIAFGIIFHPESSHLANIKNNKDIFNRIMDYVDVTKQVIGVPDHVIFQSWIWFWTPAGKIDYKNGTAMPSINLPENNNTNLYSFLYTLKQGWYKLNKDLNNAQFVSQSVPLTVSKGQKFNVSITMKNVGKIPWSNQGAGHHLGSFNPQSNTIWNVSRVFLGDKELINPGQNKTFTFQVQAPNKSGIYDFQWKMIQEQVEWFGEASQNLKIKVK